MVRLIEKPHLEFELYQPQHPSSGGGAYLMKKVGMETHAWAQDVFTEKELDAIINIGKSIGLSRGHTYNLKHDPGVRNSFVAFMYPNATNIWVFDRIQQIASQINDQFFQFDLDSMSEGFQFTQYKEATESELEHYDWHIDCGPTVAHRKLSLSLQLSDPDDYEGGDLQITFGKEPYTMSRTRGQINFFPSYTTHRVTPVTKGVRYSLVCWISGPKFR